VTYAEGGRNFIDCYDCWIAVTLLQAADVLLAKAGYFGELFLRQSLLLAEPLHIPADQSAHIHAQKSADYILKVYQL
jgi:hypothetical protein